MKQTRKCKECGAQTYFTNMDGTPSETCQNCKFLLDTFWMTVAALNAHVPLTGRPRKIEILQYKITKV